MSDYEIGHLKGRVDGLEDDVKEIKADVKSILATVNQSRGGFKTLLAVSGISGTFGALLVKIIPFTSSLPK